MQFHLCYADLNYGAVLFYTLVTLKSFLKLSQFYFYTFIPAKLGSSSFCQDWISFSLFSANHTGSKTAWPFPVNHYSCLHFCLRTCLVFEKTIKFNAKNQATSSFVINSEAMSSKDILKIIFYMIPLRQTKNRDIFLLM